ncbi:MAG: hypothetical protein KDI56_15820 [Xanthomonadales bacterium]|nr:hypothetical protein [Xanthomonadales bacterium]
MNADRPSAAAQDAARLLAGRLDAEQRAAIIDRLLDDPESLQALRSALPLQMPAEQLAQRVAGQTRGNRWFSGWSLAGWVGAGAAAALMLLAGPVAGPEQLIDETPQHLVADVLYNGSFEPGASGELFGGDFEG